MVKPHYAVVHSRLGKRERQVSQARSKRSHEMAAEQQRMAEFYAFITPVPFSSYSSVTSLPCVMKNKNDS